MIDVKPKEGYTVIWANIGMLPVSLYPKIEMPIQKYEATFKGEIIGWVKDRKLPLQCRFEATARPFGGRREAACFDTLEDAKQFVMSLCLRNVGNRRKDLL